MFYCSAALTGGGANYNHKPFWFHHSFKHLSASVLQFRRPKLFSLSILMPRPLHPSYLQQWDLSEIKDSGWNLSEASFPEYCPTAESAGRAA